MAYGDRFPDEGITGPSGSVPNSTIYHGCPPASEWLGGLYTLAVGPDDLWKFRLVPTALSILAAAVFAWALIREFGAARAAFIYGSCLMAPMFTNMSHSVYYHSYAFGMLLIEISLALHRCASGVPPRPHRTVLPARLRAGVVLLRLLLRRHLRPGADRSARDAAREVRPVGGRGGDRPARRLRVLPGPPAALRPVGPLPRRHPGGLAEFSYRSKKHYGVPWRRS